MNKKKRLIIVGGLLVFIIVLGIIIGIFYAKKSVKITNKYVGGVQYIDFSEMGSQPISDSLNINAGGVYTVTGDIDGTIKVDADKKNVKIVLDNANITSNNGPAIYVDKVDNIYIELVGTNTIKTTTTEEEHGAIFSDHDICFIGDGSLTINSNYDGIVTKDDLQIDGGTITIKADDDGIVGKDSVVVNNGTINITSEGDGIKTTNDTGKGTITLRGGEFNITAQGDDITSISYMTIEGGTYNLITGTGATTSYLNNASMKGLKSKDEMVITGGTINIQSSDDSIHSDKNIIISGGELNIASADDGIHADQDLIINDGIVNITKAYEGIEGLNITVNGGDIKVVANDDGFNAAGGDGSSQGRPGSSNYNETNSSLTITGGNIYVNSSGDGLDSNGNLYIKGGTIYIDGPINDGNGAVDYGDNPECKFEVTGGTLIAVGSKGMSVAPTSSSIVSVLINTTTYKGDITFGDITYTPSKTYSSILICSDSLSVGNTYELKIDGNVVQSITINNNITTSGTTGFKGGPGGGDHGGGPGGQPPRR